MIGVGMLELKVSDRGYVKLAPNHIRDLCVNGMKNLQHSYDNCKIEIVMKGGFRKKEVKFKKIKFCHAELSWTKDNINRMIQMCDNVESNLDNFQLIELNFRVFTELLKLNTDVENFNPYWFGKEY